jgi:hypothetical protein
MKTIDYSNTIIYKIVCNDLSVKDCYVGHTVCFRKRKHQHKHTCNNEISKDYNMKVYKIIRANGGWDNFTMIEIEKFNCNDGNEARARERYWYEQLQANMNFVIPNRTLQEYRKDNDEIIKQKKKLYAQTNKELISEYKKDYHEINKEAISEKRKETITCICGSVVCKNHRLRHEKSIKHQQYLEQTTTV